MEATPMIGIDPHMISTDSHMVGTDPHMIGTGSVYRFGYRLI